VPKKIFIPFDLPVFQTINSNHPLLASLVEREYEGIDFIRSDSLRGTNSEAVMTHAAKLCGQISSLRASPIKTPDVEMAIAAFVASRDFASQMLVPTDVDLAFFHTAPVHLNQIDWFLHIESISQIFRPQILQGRPPPFPLREMTEFWGVRTLLESPRCRAIFSNLESTCKQVSAVFSSSVIDAKMHHVPAGPWFTPSEERIVEEHLAQRAQREEVKILFTNSWHDGPESFILRGGLDVLVGFLKIAEQCPNLKLVIRSSLPPMLSGTNIEEIMNTHPRIQLITERLKDDEMVRLFADADIFALNAAALHSISLMRAMTCACACIVSDVPGYSEYLKDGESGIVMQGLSARVNRIDQSSGWILDDYTDFLTSPFKKSQSEAMADILLALYESKELRSKLGYLARERVLARNSFANWQSGFERIMRGCLANDVECSSQAQASSLML